MNILRPCLLLVLCCAIARAADPSGFWKGAIELPNQKLAIEVDLAKEKDKWSGAINVPAQGLRGFALSGVAVEGDRVRFALEGIPGDPSFDGKLVEDSISGTVTQGGQQLNFVLQRAEKKAGEGGPALPAKPVPGDGAAGEWMGALAVGPVTLRLALHLAEKDGELSGTMDSLDQGAIGMEIDTIAFKERGLNFEMKAIGGSFKGELNKDGSAFEGTWSQGGNKLPLVFHRLETAYTLKRPQEPRAPFPYKSREVSFRNEAAKIKLAGTLIVPDGEGPFPAVLFISGSGAQDRDESLMGHKPFLVIADYLARRGIASLRYDDRGAGASEGEHIESTVSDFAADAEAGLAFLAAQKETGEAIGILGHSEGGLSGPKIAVNNKAVDFLVLLAPPGERLDLLIQRQGRDLRISQGIDEALLKRASEGQEEDLALLKDESLSRDDLKAKLLERTEEWKKNFTEEELKTLGYDEAVIEQNLSMSTSPWFRSLMREDPVVYFKTIKIPVLALLAEKDVQVAPDVNATLIEAALEESGNEDYTVQVLPGLNHLFQHCDTGAIAEYGMIEETFAPEALEIVGDWIVERFGPK